MHAPRPLHRTTPHARRTGTLLLCLLAHTAATSADTLTIGSTRHDGTFLEYAEGRFVFQATSGERVEKARAYVRTMTLDPAREARVTASDGGVQHGRLTGYAQSRFTFEDGSTHLAMRVQRVAPTSPAASREPAPPAADGPGAGDASLDIRPLLARDDLSAAQRAALARYREADRAYRAFVTESSRLVHRMQTSTGRARDDALEALRMRKVAEQPVRAELAAARAALRQAVPEPWGDAHARPTASSGTGRDSDVFLLDVAPLRRGDPPPTAEQLEAIDRYAAAQDKYLDVASNGDAPRIAYDQAVAGLHSALNGLLRAFPTLTIER